MNDPSWRRPQLLPCLALPSGRTFPTWSCPRYECGVVGKVKIPQNFSEAVMKNLVSYGGINTENQFYPCNVMKCLPLSTMTYVLNITHSQGLVLWFYSHNPHPWRHNASNGNGTCGCLIRANPWYIFSPNYIILYHFPTQYDSMVPQHPHFHFNINLFPLYDDNQRLDNLLYTN